MTRWLLILALGLVGSSARAEVRIDRNDGVLSEADLGALHADAVRWPFDVGVVAGSFRSRAALVDAVHACTHAHDVCVGVDPMHHHAEAHFGIATGVPASAFGTVATAGRDAFRREDWRRGIEAVADSAKGAAQPMFMTSPGPAAFESWPNRPPVAPSPPPSAALAIGLSLLATASTVVLVAWLWRMRRRARALEQRLRAVRAALAEERGAVAEERAERDFEARLKATPGANAPAPASARASWDGDRSRALRDAMPPPAAAVPRATAPLRLVPRSRVSAPTAVFVQPVATPPGDGAADVLLGYEIGRSESSDRAVVEREVVREREEDAGGAGTSWSSDDPATGEDAGGAGTTWDEASSAVDAGGGDSSGDGGGGGTDW